MYEESEKSLKILSPRPNANVPTGMPTAFINTAIKSKSQLTCVCFCQLVYASSQNVLKTENEAEWPPKKVENILKL